MTRILLFIFWFACLLTLFFAGSLIAGCAVIYANAANYWMAFLCVVGLFVLGAMVADLIRERP